MCEMCALQFEENMEIIRPLRAKLKYFLKYKCVCTRYNIFLMIFSSIQTCNDCYL